MNISTGQSYLVIGTIYIVGVIILALRLRWINSQYVKPLYSARTSIAVSLTSWILLVAIGIYISWEHFRDWIESNNEDKFNMITDKYYKTSIKYNNIVDKHIKARKLLIEVVEQTPRVASEKDGDISCYFCNAGVSEDHDKDCTYAKIQDFLKRIDR